MGAEKRGRGKFVAACICVVTLAGLFAASVTSTTACVGKQCEARDAINWGFEPGQGELVTPDIWESAPQESRWLDFAPASLIVFHPVPLRGRGIFRVNTYVAADPEPNRPGDSFTTGAGALATITVLGDDVFVGNSTCAPYYLRVVVEAYPARDAGPADAESDGPLDGALDGPADAPSDTADAGD